MTNEKRLILPLVLLLSLTGVSFMTPIPWSEEGEKMSLHPDLGLRPENFEPILSSKSDSNLFFRIDSLLSTAYAKGRFNGQILYAEDGQILYNKAFGYSDLQAKKELETDDRFQLASTSKPFAAVAVMLLQQEGKIDIEKPVKTYLPDFPFEQITVKQLLQHRSGLPNYIYVADQYWDFRKPITNGDITPLLKKYSSNLEFTPGSRFKYCNTNYAYLASLIEKITTKSFPQALQEYIFKPVGMIHTFVYDHKIPQPQDVVKGYSFSRKRGFYVRDPDYLDGVVGDKGIYSTAEDLFLFDKALYNDLFLKPKSRELVFAPAVPFDEKHKSDYGVGFRVKEECNGQDVAYHHGWWKGFRTYFIHDYQNKRTLIWLNNRSDVTISPYLNFIMDFASIEVDASGFSSEEEAEESVPLEGKSNKDQVGENYGDE